jgi:uncharacterized NAD(P)/FAD-binding protein YdhS
LAKGPTYATPNANQLLNVRAANMNAYDSGPSVFERWLGSQQRRAAGPRFDDASCRGETYGRYLRATLEAACFGAKPEVHLVKIEAEVSDLAIDKESIELTAADGRQFRVDCAALCFGNFPAALPAGLDLPSDRLDRYIAVPWGVHALDGIGPRDAVAVIGTALTMVDVVLDLCSRGHQGSITALSRRGPHAGIPPEC